ncbi:MAG TPA: circularly permuted type 2 ATP-grasp protein, partial [Gemmataceae bacterium]|nr:circularly permuted type 2 ATP-grasp protein [Gemmataceae bacterium]
PRHLVLRAYLAAEGDSFAFMPGGLTRVSASADTRVVSMQRGGGSKDTWVLSAGPVSNFSLLRSGALPVELTRGGSDLPSRVADNLYWLGRYAERAEGLTRLLRCVLVRLTETSGLTDVPELPLLLRTATRLTESYPGFIGDGAAGRLAAPENELLALIHDTRRPGSLASVLGHLSNVAGMVRDRISTDMWRVLRDLGRVRRSQGFFAHGGDGPPNGDRRTLSAELDLLDGTVLTLAAFGGLAMESVTRGEGWRFLDMGRKLERALHTIGIVRWTLTSPPNPEGPVLEAILEIADSAMTYRRRYQRSPQAVAVLDLLLADETNPRSLAFQLAALADDVEHLPRDASRPGRTPEERLMLSSLTMLRLAEVRQLAGLDECGGRPALDDLLGRLASALPALSDALTHTYLSHLQTSRHLAALE